MKIEVRQGDLLEFEGDAILIPTLSDGTMRLPLASRVKEVVGQTIEDQVISHAPIAVGAAIMTSADGLPAKYLVHAPLLESDEVRVGVESIRRATRAGLLAASHYELESLAIPGMQPEDSTVSRDEAARAIIDEILGHKSPHLHTIVLIDSDPEMVDAFRTQAASS